MNIEYSDNSIIVSGSDLLLGIDDSKEFGDFADAIHELCGTAYEVGYDNYLRTLDELDIEEDDTVTLTFKKKKKTLEVLVSKANGDEWDGEMPVNKLY